jgi:hypothetical protein
MTQPAGPGRAARGRHFAMPGGRLLVTHDALGTTCVVAVTAIAGPLPGVAVPAKAVSLRPIWRM